MRYGFPNWMFAAIAIAGYEAASWLGGRLHQPQLVKVGYVVVALCVVIIGVRWIIGRIRSRRQDDSVDDEDWRNF